MKHLKIWFTDGTDEELESKYSRIAIQDSVLRAFNEDGYGTREVYGASYPLASIKKWQWVEGYK